MSAYAAFEINVNLSPEQQKILSDWRTRLNRSRADRRQYEIQWQKNQMYAAGIQWLRYNMRDHRVLEVIKDDAGRLLDVVDVLSQYNQTAIGKLAAGDFRPELLTAYDNDDVAEQYTEQLNRALEYAWEEELRGDRKLISVLRCLVELGTSGMRCRYDRSQGKLIAQDVPHFDGRPMLPPAPGGEEQTYNVDGYQMTRHAIVGSPGLQSRVDFRTVREGKIVWEKLSAWNILPPPGVEDPDDFPWELIVRPVALTDLEAIYGDRAQGVGQDRIEDMGLLAYSFNRAWDPGLNQTLTPATVTKLEDHALVYTGYLRPTPDYPHGQTVVFTNDGHLLAADDSLPYNVDPWGPRSGITYFRWQILEGRFWGRSFMEPGMGPQKIRNKRLSQIDETIDRGQAKLIVQKGSLDKAQLKGNPVEILYLEPGAPQPVPFAGVAPGAWMQADIQLQDDNIERALGIKQVSLGNAPSGVSAYSAMAMLSENDAQKLDPIAQEFRLGIADVVRDTIEAMNEWPSDKQLYIAGEQNQLRVEMFDKAKAIPPAFLARPAKGAALPRSQAAEVQKIADLANYAATIGASQANPADWLDWYRRSLDAGKVLPLPSVASFDQQHRAELENSLMAFGAPAPPVTEYDDAQVHIPLHRNSEMQAQTALVAAQGNGDQHGVMQAQQQLQALEQHIQMHLGQAEQNAQQNAGNFGVPGTTIPNTEAKGGGFLPQPRYINQLQTPRPPIRILGNGSTTNG